MKVTANGKVTKLFETRQTKTGKRMDSFEVLLDGAVKSWIKVIALDINLPAIAESADVSIVGSVSADAYINKEGKAVGKLVVFADSVQSDYVPRVKNIEDVPF